jgi:hypothetical protein
MPIAKKFCLAENLRNSGHFQKPKINCRSVIMNNKQICTHTYVATFSC